MFRYGLIGNALSYGGIVVMFGYLGYEMNNIRSLAAQVPEEMAREICDPKNTDKLQGSQRKADVKLATTKLYIQEYQRQQFALKKAKAAGEPETDTVYANYQSESKQAKKQLDLKPDI